MYRGRLLIGGCSDVLAKFEKVEAIGEIVINMRYHPSNGQLTRADSVMATYTICCQDDNEQLVYATKMLRNASEESNTSEHY